MGIIEEGIEATANASRLKKLPNYQYDSVSNRLTDATVEGGGGGIEYVGGDSESVDVWHSGTVLCTHPSLKMSLHKSATP